MTWHTQNSTHSTSSREQEEAFSLTSYLDTIRSEPVKSNPIRGMSCLPDSETESFPAFPSGTMSVHSTEILGEEQLTFFAGDSPALTSVQPGQTIMSTERSEDLTERSRGYGQRWLESLEKFGLSLCLLKTPQILEQRDSLEFLTTLGTWGIMQDGVCWAAKILEPITTASEFGYLPTPTSHNSKEGAYPAEFTRKTPTLSAQIGGKINPQWNELRMGWPLGWTKIGESDSRQSATDKTQRWLQQHSTFSQKD